MTKREIMKLAHKLAKEMEGHYTARLALGLRLAWKEAKMEKKKELTVGTELPGWGDRGDGFWEAMNSYPEVNEVKTSSESFLRIFIGEKKFNRLQDEDWRVEMNTRVEVVRETEKAIQIRIKWEEREFDGEDLEDEDEGAASFWLPKSQVKWDEENIVIPGWVAKKNRLQNYGEKFSVITKVEDL